VKVRKNRQQAIVPYVGVGRRKRVFPKSTGNETEREIAMGFALAVLDPMCDNRLPFLGIPDGYAGNTCAFTNRTNFVVTPDPSGRITFAMIPSFPSQVFVFAGTTVWSDTSPTGFGTIHPVVALSTNNDWLGLPCNTWASSLDTAINTMQVDRLTGTNVPVFINETISGSKARFAGLSFEVRPTGTILNTTGRAVVARGPIRTGKATASAVNGTDIIPFMFLNGVPNNFNDAMHVPGARQCTILDGSYTVAVGDQSEDRWDFDDFLPSTILKTGAGFNVFTDAYWYSNAPGNLPNETAVQLQPQFSNWFHFDTNHPSGFVGSTFLSNKAGYIVYAAEGLPAGYGMEVECIATSEIVPETGSVFIEATSRSLPRNAAILAEVTKVQAMVPMCASYRDNDSGEWTKRILSLLSGGLQFVARLGLPVVSNVAALGHELGKMFLNMQ